MFRLVRFPRLSRMVPVSWLLWRFLQQREHEAETIRREKDKDGVRFIRSTLMKHDRQQERKRGRTYSCCRLLRFPRLAGMVPVSCLFWRILQQWEHE